MVRFDQLDEVLNIIKQELPSGQANDELQWKLAVEVLKANLVRDAILELSHAMERVADSIVKVEGAIKEHSL